MQTKDQQNQQRQRAKNKLRRIKLFYIHLAGYAISVLLLLYNLYIIDKNNPYAAFFTWFNTTIIIVCTILIILNWWYAFKGKIWFKSTWEDKKMEAFMKKDNNSKKTKIWE